MPKETIKARNARIGDLLHRYYELSTQQKKIDRDLKDLKEQVREVEPGTYDGWVREIGGSRDVMDQAAVKADYAARNVEVPTVRTQPAIIVRPADEVAATGPGSRRRR